MDMAYKETFGGLFLRLNSLIALLVRKLYQRPVTMHPLSQLLDPTLATYNFIDSITLKRE